MTIYELVRACTVQGNVKVTTLCKDNEIVLFTMENDYELDYCDLNECWEDQDVLYMYASHTDGYLHIEIEAPEYVCVKEKYWAEWFGFTPEDEIGGIAFDALPEFAEAEGKTVAELLEQCEAH